MLSSTIPFLSIVDEYVRNAGIFLYILRTDLNDPLISGNKLFKLKYNLIEAERQGKKTLLTFGGAYSNHIAATAAAGKKHGFDTIGIIRGEAYETLNPTLVLAKECGMQLHYVSRNRYQNKKELYAYVNDRFDPIGFYLIPEGGSNHLGISGCKEIIDHVPVDFEYITVACGTGATFTGIIQSLKKDQRALGFQVLKSHGYIKNEVLNWLDADTPLTEWDINEDYHFGGYAKRKRELIGFVDWFWANHRIPLDYVYTGKMMYGIYDLIRKGFFKKGQTIVAIHTGGLQGNAGFVNLKV